MKENGFGDLEVEKHRKELKIKETSEWIVLEQISWRHRGEWVHRNKNEVFLNESLRSFLISFFNYVNNLHSQKNYFQLIRNARQKNWAEQKKWKLTIGRKAGNKIITKNSDFAVCRPKSTLIGYIKCAGWSFIESNKC
jgi:hypothetical protein